MGTKRRVEYEMIPRDKVYLVIRYQTYHDPEILRAYTTLRKAEEYIEKFEAENKEYLKEDVNNFGKRYTWFDTGFDYFYIRISAYELDADYDEVTYVRCNPTDEGDF